MRVVSVVGTRPNLVKEFLINKELKKNSISEIVIHTGQHYDYEMSQAFFEDFNLPKPDYFLNVNNSSPLKFLAKSIDLLEDIIKKENPDVVLSYGDVNSTSAAAIVSSKLNIPFVHIEGGIRSKALYNPEEINRRISDHLAKLIFCCTKSDIETLKKENFENSRYFLSGDLMYDALKVTIEEFNIPIKCNKYLVATIHRQENVDNDNRLKLIIDVLMDSKLKVYFSIHPRTEKKLKNIGLWQKIEKSENISILKPQKYTDFIKLLAGCSRVFTDSGGVRREAYLLGKPCIVPINIVWFPEIVKAGWMKVIDNDYCGLLDAVLNFQPTNERPNIFGDGSAHKLIVNEIIKRFG